MDCEELTMGQSTDRQVSKPTGDNINHLDLPYSGKLLKGANFRIIRIGKHCSKFKYLKN